MNQLTPFQKQKLSGIFKQFDKNGDGTISLREFKLACRKYNDSMPSREIDTLAGQMDIDGNGMIDLEEFCLCMASHISRKQARNEPVRSPTPRRQNLTTQQMRDAFTFFDKDKSGAISPSELRQVMQTLGVRCTDTEFRSMMTRIDENKDGVVDFGEFCTLLNTLL